MDSSNISLNSLAKKLVFKRVGPFQVIKKVRLSAYELQIPKVCKNLYPVISKSKIKPYHRPTFTQQSETLLIVIIPNQKSSIYKVKRILNSRIWGGAGCNILSNSKSKSNHLRNLYRRIEVKLSRVPPNYVRTSTIAIWMHLKFLQFGFQKDCTVISWRYNLRRRVILWFTLVHVLVERTHNTDYIGLVDSIAL